MSSTSALKSTRVSSNNKNFNKKDLITNTKTQFRKMPTPAPSIYLYSKEQNLTSFFALIQAVDLINKYDSRPRLGLAFENPSLKRLAESVKWASLPPMMVSDLDDSLTPVVALDPPSTRVDDYQKRDNALDFEIAKEKYPNVDPEQLKLPDFKYTRPMALIRDAYEVFDVLPGERPVALFEEVRNPRWFWSKNLASASYKLLRANGIYSGPFTLVEKGFVGSGSFNKSTNKYDYPSNWGKTIELPNPEKLLNDPDMLEAFIGLMFHPDCAALGVYSTDYILPSVAAWRLNHNVVWDMRPCQADPDESIQARSELKLRHLPDDTENISLVHPMDDEPKDLIEKDLAYAIEYYHNTFKESISQNKKWFDSFTKSPIPPRPIPPDNYSLK